MSDRSTVNEEQPVKHPEFTRFRDERLKNPGVRAAYEEAKARRDADENELRPPYRWGDLSHLIPPGEWFAPRFTHMERCTCLCSEIPTCPTCGKPTQTDRVRGRWDAEKGHTAQPFEPVWVRLSCGCTFGDSTRADVVLPPGMDRADG